MMWVYLFYIKGKIALIIIDESKKFFFFLKYNEGTFLISGSIRMSFHNHTDGLTSGGASAN